MFFHHFITREHRHLPISHEKKRLHIGFEDPADAVGTGGEVMAVCRMVRDQIRTVFWNFYPEKLKEGMNYETARY